MECFLRPWLEGCPTMLPAGLGVLGIPKTISGIINIPGNVNNMFFFMELQTTLNIHYAGHEITRGHGETVFSV
jgi:hypothetical protein